MHIWFLTTKFYIFKANRIFALLSLTEKISIFKYIFKICAFKMLNILILYYIINNNYYFEVGVLRIQSVLYVLKTFQIDFIKNKDLKVRKLALIFFLFVLIFDLSNLSIGSQQTITNLCIHVWRWRRGSVAVPCALKWLYSVSLLCWKNHLLTKCSSWKPSFHPVFTYIIWFTLCIPSQHTLFCFLHGILLSLARSQHVKSTYFQIFQIKKSCSLLSYNLPFILYNLAFLKLPYDQDL